MSQGSEVSVLKVGLETILAHAGDLLPRLGSAVFFIVVIVVVYRLLARGLSELQRRKALNEPIVRVIRQGLRWIIGIVVILGVLYAFDLIEDIWIVLSTLAGLVAIGFVAVWSVLSNLLCSLMLMITRPFRVGDTLESPTHGLSGKVVNFSLIFTTLRDEDGALIHVPNNAFFQGPIRCQPGKNTVDLQEQLPQREPVDVQETEKTTSH